MKGTPGAPIQVVEYADFLCPACRSLAAGLAEFLPRSAGRIALHFKHYPLDSACNAPAALHPGACILARGGICAQQQGKFWPYHDRVFGSSELKNPGRDDVLRLAGEAGLDRTAFAACLDSPQALERLRADIQEAKTIEVSVTPTLVVNGKKLKQLHDFMFAIEKESRRRGLGPLLDAGGQGR